MTKKVDIIKKMIEFMESVYNYHSPIGFDSLKEDDNACYCIFTCKGRKYEAYCFEYECCCFYNITLTDLTTGEKIINFTRRI